MPIDLASVNWLYVVVLAVFVFVGTLVGNLLSFNHRGMAAMLSALAFATMFVFWTYYPHGVPFLPTSISAPEGAGRHGRTGGPAPAPGEAAQPGHRHHAALEQLALGLHRTVKLMFSHLVDVEFAIVRGEWWSCMKKVYPDARAALAGIAQGRHDDHGRAVSACAACPRR